MEKTIDDGITFTTNSPAATEQVGEAFGKLVLESGNKQAVALYGDLGAGKTCFVKGVARALGVTGTVNSPTFSIINSYFGKVTFFHIDAYRLKEPGEILAIGFEDYVEEGICFIEWPEKIGSLLPKSAIKIKFLIESETTRKIIVELT